MKTIQCLNQRGIDFRRGGLFFRRKDAGTGANRSAVNISASVRTSVAAVARHHPAREFQAQWTGAVSRSCLKTGWVAQHCLVAGIEFQDVMGTSFITLSSAVRLAWCSGRRSYAAGTKPRRV